MFIEVWIVGIAVAVFIGTFAKDMEKKRLLAGWTIRRSF